VLIGCGHSYCTHSVPVRGQLPYDPRRASRELRGLFPSFNASTLVSPEWNDVDGFATTARFTSALASVCAFALHHPNISAATSATD
jgi:hypothetical protein